MFAKNHRKVKFMWNNLPDCDDCDDFSEIEIELCDDCADLLDGIIHSEGLYIEPDTYNEWANCQCCGRNVESINIYAKR